MKLGVHRETLAASLDGADEVWLYAPADLGWDVAGAMAPLGARLHVRADVDTLAADLVRELRGGDQLLIMSNGGFGGLHDKVLAGLAAPRSHGRT
jgi:UDP-N-acetylmuramate: L-alanyl-gamma-D-glutamyl-meso-diaminopimelate ligase